MVRIQDINFANAPLPLKGYFLFQQKVSISSVHNFKNLNLRKLTKVSLDSVFFFWSTRNSFKKGEADFFFIHILPFEIFQN